MHTGIFRLKPKKIFLTLAAASLALCGLAKTNYTIQRVCHPDDVKHYDTEQLRSRFMMPKVMEESNDRVINQLIVNNVLEEGPCQLQMGLTELKPGSVWNTMPAHTHDRRVEAYFYFNVPEGNAVLHLMGEPQEERLIWLHNEQAVMSPEWSIHAAAGTSNYMFIWGMGGENLNYGDMDKIQYLEMK